MVKIRKFELRKLRHTEITIAVHQSVEFKVRVRIALFLIKLATLVLGCSFHVKKGL